MTQEDKEPLLRDLSARLPYGIKVSTTDNDNMNNKIRVIEKDFNDK